MWGLVNVGFLLFCLLDLFWGDDYLVFVCCYWQVGFGLCGGMLFDYVVDLFYVFGFVVDLQVYVVFCGVVEQYVIVVVWGIVGDQDWLFLMVDVGEDCSLFVGYLGCWGLQVGGYFQVEVGFGIVFVFGDLFVCSGQFVGFVVFQQGGDVDDVFWFGVVVIFGVCCDYLYQFFMGCVDYVDFDVVFYQFVVQFVLVVEYVWWFDVECGEFVVVVIGGGDWFVVGYQFVDIVFQFFEGEV